MPTLMTCEQTTTTYFDDGSIVEKVTEWEEEVKNKNAVDSDSETVTLYGDTTMEDFEDILAEIEYNEIDTIIIN